MRMTLVAAAVLAAGAGVRGQSPEKPKFLAAEECALCHTRIPAPGGDWRAAREWAGQVPLWQGSMMARSSADPYWRARVKFEGDAAPERRGEVENTCLRCHGPAQQYPLRAARRHARVADLDEPGQDGVTCTVCHQILNKGLGTAASFTAGFETGVKNEIFGPHAAPFTMPMLHHVGMTATEGRHVLESALCGTCHTVVTRPGFVEQGPYLEWLASDFARQGRSCQQCHMPQLVDASGQVAAQHIAHRPPGGPFPPTRARTPFGRHEFAGGNVAVAEAMGKGTGQRARRQLERALRLEVAARREGAGVVAEVTVVNLTGHKLPTGFPSRRLWLHVTLEDAAGRVVFESGAWEEATGSLKTGEAARPHFAAIEKPEQVQVFETEEADEAGEPTLLLLKAARHVKDNRILPAGFSSARRKAAGLEGLKIDPAGVEGDAGFRPGSARTLYRLPAAPGGRLKAEAVFQTIKPSHRPAELGLAPEFGRAVVAARAETGVQ